MGPASESSSQQCKQQMPRCRTLAVEIYLFSRDLAYRKTGQGHPIIAGFPRGFRANNQIAGDFFHQLCFIDWALKRQLNHIWRLFGTALSFSLFGIGGLLLGLLFFPALFLFIRDPLRRQVAARKWIGRAFCLFISIMKNLGVLSYRIHGREGLTVPANCLIVANHPTLIDVVFLICLFPQADCVIKSLMWRNPFTRFVVLAANYIPNNDGADLLEICIDRLQHGDQLILFPEGTRSKPGQKLRFKPGAAAIAVRAGASLQPVLIGCTPMTLTKGEPWYHIPETKPFFEFQILDLTRPDDLVGNGMERRRKEKALNRAMEGFFRHHMGA